MFSNSNSIYLQNISRSDCKNQSMRKRNIFFTQIQYIKKIRKSESIHLKMRCLVPSVSIFPSRKDSESILVRVFLPDQGRKDSSFSCQKVMWFPWIMLCFHILLFDKTYPGDFMDEEIISPNWICLPFLL